ncbi:MAG: hypothetical protein WDN76_04990 [Alphaproteobacteria bacterium]
MRSLVPLAAFAEVQQDVERAQTEGAKNAAPSGLGWSDIYLARPPTIDYSAIPLRLRDAAALLEKWFPRILNFTATASAGFSPGVRDPYGSYETDAQCYGTGASCFIKLEHKESVVHGIWFEGQTDNREDMSRLRHGLMALDAIVPSAIADYWLSTSGAIGDQAFMDRYFDALLSPDD